MEEFSHNAQLHNEIHQGETELLAEAGDTEACAVIMFYCYNCNQATTSPD